MADEITPTTLSRCFTAGNRMAETIATLEEQADADELTNDSPVLVMELAILIGKSGICGPDLPGNELAFQLDELRQAAWRGERQEVNRRLTTIREAVEQASDTESEL